MANQVMRITLKAYDHELVDSSARKIIDTVKKTGSQVSGPVPLPTKKEIVRRKRSLRSCVLFTNIKIPVSSSSREPTKD